MMLLAQLPAEMPTTTIGLFALVILSLIGIIGGGGKMVSSHLSDLIKCFREDSAADRAHHKDVTAQLAESISNGFGRVEGSVDKLDQKVSKNNLHLRTLASKLKVDLQDESDG